MRVGLPILFGLAALLSACGQTRAVKPGPGAPPAVAICGDFSFPIYFSSGAELDPQAKAVLAEAAGQAGALTAQGEPEPLRRRVEVVIRSGPPPAP